MTSNEENEEPTILFWDDKIVYFDKPLRFSTNRKLPPEPKKNPTKFAATFWEEDAGA